ncbi:MAG: hypothetical protein QM657_15150 [Lacrimispora sp.]|uniref:hypothetical protein n=1 Tax=Lacrimispora sp. TaxID=2719234 RepID=UPI0039E381FC
MNLWKKNSVKQESYKNDGKGKIPEIHLWLAWIGVIAFMLGAFVAAERHYIPKYYARFYLTRSVLQTRGRLLDLWGRERGNMREARESLLELKAEEARWNGLSVPVISGGLGVSWRHIKNEDNTFAQGNLKVYFLEKPGEGLDYWADEENVLLCLPGAGGFSVKTSQEAIKQVVGFSLIPQKENGPRQKFEALKEGAVTMMNQSEIQFDGRDEEGIRLKAVIPASVFEQYLGQVGGFLEEEALRDIKEWGRLLTERKTGKEVQEVLFTIDKKLNISSIQVEGLADVSLLLEINRSASIKGRIGIGDREADLETVVYSGSGQKGRRVFDIPSLNLAYKKENVRIDLKLSGGYEGGRVGKEELDCKKLSSAEEEWDDGRLQEEKEGFLKKAGQLGFDFGRERKKDIDK